MNKDDVKIPTQDEDEAGNVSGGSQSDMESGEVALQKAKAEAEKNLDGWRRTQADFENYQKRKEAENKELIEFAREVAVAKLLPTLDTIEQSLLHVPDDLSKLPEWKNGMDGTLKKLQDTMAELGVKRISALGKKFETKLKSFSAVPPVSIMSSEYIRTACLKFGFFGTFKVFFIISSSIVAHSSIFDISAFLTTPAVTLFFSK